MAFLPGLGKALLLVLLLVALGSDQWSYIKKIKGQLWRKHYATGYWAEVDPHGRILRMDDVNWFLDEGYEIPQGFMVPARPHTLEDFEDDTPFGFQPAWPGEGPPGKRSRPNPAHWSGGGGGGGSHWSGGGGGWSSNQGGQEYIHGHGWVPSPSSGSSSGPSNAWHGWPGEAWNNGGSSSGPSNAWHGEAWNNGGWENDWHESAWPGEGQTRVERLLDEVEKLLGRNARFDTRSFRSHVRRKLRRLLQREGYAIPGWLEEQGAMSVMEFKKRCAHLTKKVLNRALDRMEQGLDNGTSACPEEGQPTGSSESQTTEQVKSPTTPSLSDTSPADPPNAEENASPSQVAEAMNGLMNALEAQHPGTLAAVRMGGPTEPVGSGLGGPNCHVSTGTAPSRPESEDETPVMDPRKTKSEPALSLPGSDTEPGQEEASTSAAAAAGLGEASASAAAAANVSASAAPAAGLGEAPMNMSSSWGFVDETSTVASFEMVSETAEGQQEEKEDEGAKDKKP